MVEITKAGWELDKDTFARSFTSEIRIKLYLELFHDIAGKDNFSLESRKFAEQVIGEEVLKAILEAKRTCPIT